MCAYDEFHSILTFVFQAHSCGGYFGAKRTAHKVLESVSIGLLFLRIHIIFANHMKNAIEHVISLIRIKCL
jgi:hypothetical protein